MTIPEHKDYPVKASSMMTLYRSLLCGIMLALPVAGMAQGFSYDGNRWYEVEVSIFTNIPAQTLFPELPPADGSGLDYPPGTRTFSTATSSLMIENEPDEVSGPLIEFDFSDTSPAPVEEPVFYGAPEFNGSSQAMLQDTAREAFTLLGPEAAGFTSHNNRLRNAGNHRLLFHGVWRQPMLNRSQAVPLAISGGNRFAPHSELEGWLRFSFNVNRIDVEANLWLMQFLPENALVTDSVPMQVPLSPEENARLRQQQGSATNEQRYQVSQVWKLQETRPVISNNLHYLDHPRLGMLVEVRPYELPLSGSEEGSEF